MVLSSLCRVQFNLPLMPHQIFLASSEAMASLLSLYLFTLLVEQLPSPNLACPRHGVSRSNGIIRRLQVGVHCLAQPH